MMVELDRASHLQAERQIRHWWSAVRRLQDLDGFASPEAWSQLETYLGVAVRQVLLTSVKGLETGILGIRERLERVAGNRETAAGLDRVRKDIIAFRTQYLRTETLLDYFGDAVNSRTSGEVSARLRACDIFAGRSMELLLGPLGKETPPVLTYLDKGLGASILKAGLRLWDGSTVNPTAAIKVTRHNLLRPTAVIHEAGHQAAYIVNWNEELEEALEQELAPGDNSIAEIWASWASEIAADAFAFANTGYAAVAALHDVLSGGQKFVFRFTPGDPHPVSYIRVLLGTGMCRRFYGAGPWDGLELAWKSHYPLEQADPDTAEVMRRSLPLLPRAVDICLVRPMRAFGGRPLVHLIDPAAVAPAALKKLEQDAGPSLYRSSHWLWNEALRVLAASGYHAAVLTGREPETKENRFDWMMTLGNLSSPRN